MTLFSDQMTSDKLRELVATRLDVPSEEILHDADLVAFGMNSLELMTIVNQLRRQGINVTYDALATEPTLDAWWHAITAATE